MTIGSSLLPLITAIGINSPEAAGVAAPIRIEFEAPAGCSSVDAFYQGVRVRTDRVRPAVPGETALQVRVRLFRVGTTIRGELKFGDQQGESETRRVDGLSCNEVVEALSLTAALALDPSATLLSGRNASDGSALDVNGLSYGAAQPPLAPTVGQAESIPGQTISNGSRPDGSGTHRSDPESGRHFDIFARASMASYVTPGLAMGAEMGARFSFPSRGSMRASVGLQGFHVSNDIVVSADSSIFRLTGVAMTLCPLQSAPAPWLEVGLCGFVAGGWLQARGIGVSHPQSVGRTWWILGVSTLASLRLYGQWRIESVAGLAAPIVTREFVVESPARTVGKTPILSPQVGLGFAFRF